MPIGMLTFDGAGQTHDSNGNMMGRSLGQVYRIADNRVQGGFRFYDSTGAFLVGELERLDYKLHMPLFNITYGRDIDLRNDVTIADEDSSFTLSNFGSAGGLGTGNGIGNGKSWIGKNSNQIGGQSVDIKKVVQALHLWGQEVKYTIPELESSARASRPIDQQKYQAMQTKYQMDMDEAVYIGDSGFGFGGLVNHPLVGITTLPNGATSGSPAWATKTPADILADVNFALTQVWTAAGFAVAPDRILIPPTQFSLLQKVVSDAGNTSILKYLLENNIVNNQQLGDLKILPSKWCVGAGAGGTIGTATGHDRMVVYYKNQDFVRYPMTMPQRTPLQWDSIFQKTTYFCRMGQLEWVYPESAGYFDGL